MVQHEVSVSALAVSPDTMSRLAAERLPSTASVLPAVLLFLSSHSAGALSRSEQRQETGGSHVDALQPPPVDVIVYGSTPSGIAAAVAASRAGRTAAIVNPSPVIGGMITGGLSCSDTGNASVIGKPPDVDIALHSKCAFLSTGVQHLSQFLNARDPVSRKLSCSCDIVDGVHEYVIFLQDQKPRRA